MKTGMLRWALKESLLWYLGAMEDSIVEGERESADESARFLFLEAADSSPEAPRYIGRLRIHAHGGLMDIDLSDPWIQIDGETRTLMFHTPKGDLAMAQFARVSETRTDDLLSVQVDDVALTSEASPLFGGQYGPYTRLDALDYSTAL